MKRIVSGGVNPAISGVDKDVGKAALSYTLAEIETSADFEEKLTSRFPKLCIHSKIQGMWRPAIKLC